MWIGEKSEKSDYPLIWKKKVHILNCELSNFLRWPPRPFFYLQRAAGPLWCLSLKHELDPMHIQNTQHNAVCYFLQGTGLEKNILKQIQE